MTTETTVATAAGVREADGTGQHVTTPKAQETVGVSWATK
jgi:hypothetical protein